MREGRTVYDNIKKSILFILPTNGGEALTILAAIALVAALIAAGIAWHPAGDLAGPTEEAPGRGTVFGLALLKLAALGAAGVYDGPLNGPNLEEREELDLDQLPDESETPPPAYASDFTLLDTALVDPLAFHHRVEQ